MMKKIFLAIFILPLSLIAQKNYPQLMDNYMKAQVDVKEFSGTVLLIQKDKVIYEKAFGLADREWNVPNTINTKYRIGSITKQFTAACILQLAEQGKLSLNDKLSKYIPDYPKGDSVTIHMLLNHTSGIANYTSLPAFWPKSILPLSRDSMIAIFKYAPYDFSPGSKWNYSNSGYFLLGYIIEKVSGENYGDYLLKNVIQKIGLKNTLLDRVDSILPYRAKGYEKDGRVWRNAMLISMEGPFSAGAMVSTVEDLHKWMKALMENKVVSPASVQKMTTPYMNHYGFGLGMDSLFKHKRIGHSGGIPGFVSYLGYYPDDDLYTIVLSNDGISSPQIAEGLASILFNQPVFVPYIPKEIKLPVTQLEKFTGTYKLISEGTDMDIIRKGDTLYRHSAGKDEVELKPESSTRLFYADSSDRFIDFEFDKNGAVSKATILNGIIKHELKKK
ncbi:MAG: serine hydrolase domain-containing protein [Ginsengibacter sp.]